MASACDTLHFDTAERLFEYLSPKNSRWIGMRAEPILYRGQGCAGWHLVPTALRSGSWLTDGKNWQHTPFSTLEQQVRAEVETLRYFWEESDQQGLRLPEDGQAIRNAFFEIDRTFQRGTWHTQRGFWPPTPLLSLLALAQHSGVPTRLLDWSRDPYVAAYFAAAVVLCRDASITSTDRIAIWKLPQGTFEKQQILCGNDPAAWQVRLITAPAADNANLHAQRGVFTLHNMVNQHSSPISLEEVFAGVLPKEIGPNPPAALTKLTLPLAEARQLLILLSQHGYHGAHLFPGFEGVARLMSERRKLQSIP